MKGLKLHGIQAGYVSWDPSNRTPELKHAGEEWAFPEYTVAPHEHRVYEFHLQLTGITEWEIEGERCVVAQNHLIGVAPGKRHSMRPLQHHAHHFIYCAIDLPAAFLRFGIPPLPISAMQTPWFLLPGGELFEAPFRLLSTEVTQDRLYRSELIDQSVGLIVTLLARLLRERQEHPPQPPARREGMETNTLAKIKGYIDANVAGKLSIEGLVDFAGISRTSLFELMRKELGMSPGAYHAQRRIDLAKTILQGHASVPLTSIALDLGFGSSQHFSAAFRKATGISPSRYREEAQAEKT